MWNSVVFIQNTHSLITEIKPSKIQILEIQWNLGESIGNNVQKYLASNRQQAERPVTFYWNTEEELKEYLNWKLPENTWKDQNIFVFLAKHQNDPLAHERENETLCKTLKEQISFLAKITGVGVKYLVLRHLFCPVLPTLGLNDVKSHTHAQILNYWPFH